MKETYSSVINYYTTDKDKSLLILAVKSGETSKEAFSADVMEFMNQYYPMETDKEDIINSLIENLFGYSVITPLINDPDISDIKIHAWDRIIIKRKGKKSISDVKFNDEEHYKRFIDSVITRNQVNASNINAIQRFTDDETSKDFILRFTLVTPFITTTKTYELIIRKVPINFPSLDDLMKEEMLTPDVAEVLIDSFKNGSMIICGANSSGKTTLLNALKEEIPHNKSAIVIQQAEELTTKTHPDMIFLHSIEGNGEADVHYDLRDLSIAALTMDIEYFIIGEIKGAEASYLLNASYTGSICGGTIHAYSAETALDKLVDYALYTSKYTKSELLAMLTSFKTIVFMKDYKVQEIDEVKGIKNGQIEYEPCYRLRVIADEDE